ncbi:MAG: hypothetical protein WCI59_08505 [Betaproteobacteria bacterium]
MLYPPRQTLVPERARRACPSSWLPGYLATWPTGNVPEPVWGGLACLGVVSKRASFIAWYGALD